MATATLEAPPERAQTRTPRRPAGRRLQALLGWNWLGGLAGWVWLFIIMLPIYWIVITSLKTQPEQFATNPLVPPSDPTLANFRLVIDSDFVRYFGNSVIVAVGAVQAAPCPDPFSAQTSTLIVAPVSPEATV